MDIEVAEERNDEVLVLSPVGRLDSGNVCSFESVVMDHVSSGERRVVVDFSRLDFISSAGMRVLLIAAKALKATVWPGKEDGGQPPLPWLLESCQVHSSHEGKMTTVPEGEDGASEAEPATSGSGAGETSCCPRESR